MHAPPYKCCVQVPARRIGKDQTNLNRSHHSSSSVKAVSRGGGHNIRLLLSHLSLSLDFSREREKDAWATRLCVTCALQVALHLSSQRAHFSFDFEDGRCVRFERHGFQYVSRRGPPLVRLASERFFRSRSGPGPTGGHLPQRKLHSSPPPEKQKIRESRLKIHA